MRVLNQDTYYLSSSDCFWLNPLLGHLVGRDVASRLDADLTVVVDVVSQVIRIILLIYVWSILHIMFYVCRFVHCKSSEARRRVTM